MSASRPLTDDQRAKSDERRARFSALAKRIGAMSDDQRAELAARVATVTTIEGRQLSIHNACLVAVQCPSATLVGGFNQWRIAGRVVRKGEHGLMIWAPRYHAQQGARTPERDIAAVRMSHEPGSAAPEAGHPAFIMVTVFDVSQTDPIDVAVSA